MNICKLRKLFEKAGLPLSKEMDNQVDLMYNDPSGQMALQGVGASPTNMDLPQHDLGGGQIPPDMPPDFSSGTTSPPMDNPIYDEMARQIRPDLQNSYKRGNQSQNWRSGEYQA